MATPGEDTDTDQYVHVAPQSSPVARHKALPDAPAVPATPPGTTTADNGWGELTEALLRQDLDLVERLRARHLRSARFLDAAGWALCSVGAVSAALCMVSDLVFRSTASTVVLAGLSGVCNALQRVPGPAEASARLYDLATRADMATAHIATILDTPRGSRGEAATVLAKVNALVGAAQAPTRPSTNTPLARIVRS